MGIIDKLLGRDEPAQNPNPKNARRRPMDADAQAVARYQYMLQTAPPEQIEAAHAEAFARLTPEQRSIALQQLASATPESERAGLRDDPHSMAQAATRAEIHQPGALHNAFGAPAGGTAGGMGGMMGGMGGMIAGSLLSSVAGGFIGSSIANTFFSNPTHESGFLQDAQSQGMEPVGYDQINDISPEQQAEMDQGMGTDPLGDPADQGGFADTSSDAGFDGGGFDSGGFDAGGFDGGGFDGGGFDG